MESTTADDLRDLNLDVDDEYDYEEYEEAEVRLAFLREPDGPEELQRHWFPDKAGGAPAWLDPADLPAGEARLCGFCGEPLRFALQVYAPLPPPPAHHHRALFVFMCPAMACLLRDQREQRAAVAGQIGSRRRSVRVFRGQLPEDSAFYYRPMAGAEEEEEVARCTGVEAAPLCAWCGTWGAEAEKACGTCAAAAGFCSENHLERHRLRCGRGGDDDGAPFSASAWPEYAMYVLDEKPLASDAEEDSSTAAQQGDGDDADQDDDIAAWMDALEEADDEDTACWASFQARVSPEQGQVLRYSVAEEGARPLWAVASGSLPGGGAPACPRCGGARRYELQLMPQLLHYLGVEARDPDPLDWSTVAVYTCERSCGGAGQGGYAEEFAWVQLLQPPTAAMAPE